MSTAEYTKGADRVAVHPANSCLDLSAIVATGFTPRDSRAVAHEAAAASGARAQRGTRREREV
ncbi:hypothetical protein [Kocuria tytonis]|uniref:hypothetical protein n=1 Tax=Kocuria tytonis TaxID=2054280 RepID=UPI0011C35789|nr:hypothetical protein [Kocuria tytonis]